jgi:hypothetical protein
VYNDYSTRPPPRQRDRGKRSVSDPAKTKTTVPGWIGGLLGRLWYVYPSVVMTVQAPPRECLKALALASKPGVARLHLRNLFTDGRRYYLDPRKDGFWLTSNSKIPWRRRARTTVAAVLYGEFSDAGGGGTRIHLRARMRLLFLLDIFIVPAFMTSLLIFAPWSPGVIIALILTLFFLSWMGHRLTATLQAAEMVYFIERALEDIAPVTIPALTAAAPDVITQDREFRQQWEKFYEAHKGEQDGEIGNEE